MNFIDDEDESGDFVSPLFLKTHKAPLPFDPSPARETDIRLCMEACTLGRECISPTAARQWADIEKRRRDYLDRKQRAKARLTAKRPKP